MKRKIALALGACMILGSGGGVYAYAKTPVAYVSMDINPSVELGVNAFDKVVSVEAYNEDGKKILENIDLKNYGINNAISTLVSHAISEGYIKEDGSSAIEITTSTDKNDIGIEFEKSLKEVTDETLDKNDIEAGFEAKSVALERRDEARKLGITPGKLNLIQKLQELDPTIDVEDYKSSSVKEIQKKTIELRKGNKVDKITTDSDITSNKVTAQNSNSSKNKNNNENDNDNDKKDENTIINTIEKQNNNNNVNSQGNNNSSKSENSSNSNSKGKGKNN